MRFPGQNEPRRETSRVLNNFNVGAERERQFIGDILADENSDDGNSPPIMKRDPYYMNYHQQYNMKWNPNVLLSHETNSMKSMTDSNRNNPLKMQQSLTQSSKEPHNGTNSGSILGQPHFQI